ncbi:MAG: ribosomal RNA small subunit methyltransferase A [Proteobacteria bacterium]|nr:ribosomal RNA small subunit methyltransferase A [Pseudomonadota bacterium]
MKRKRPFSRKRFGQHFLNDSSVIEKIISSADPTPEDHVLEIGPGKGSMTASLLDSGAHLTAVEVDRDLVEELEGKFGDRSKFSLLQGDILKFDWSQLIQADRKNKIVSNLPYNISTPVFFKFVEYRRYFYSVTIMVQKELASRICHTGEGKKLKDYGILSVIAGNTFETEWICNVSSSSFVPRPKVDSTVIRLHPKNTGLPNEKEFFKFVRGAFNYRRKLLLTTLRKNESDLYGDLPPETLQYLTNLRPENLLPLQYLKLFEEHRL